MKRVILLLTSLMFLNCASTKPPVIYLPTQNSEVMSFYRNGLPIGVVNTDSSFIIVLFEPTDVGDIDYMRLWLLYKNNSNTPYLLEPLKAVKFYIQGKKKSYNNIFPESPTKILANIENEKAVSLIAQAIGGALQAMSTEHPYERERAIDRTTSSIGNTVILYDIFKESINSGILRRNTVFPGESVNGYIYFPLPIYEISYGKYDAINTAKYNYRLYIITQDDTKSIDFMPASGE